MSYLYSVTVKIVLSGLKVTIVPVLSVSPIIWISPCGLPILYSWTYILPSRCISARKSLESAFTHDTPTPWSPPETLYESLLNLPPAWRTVITTSKADFPSFSWRSTGIPRPSSVTVIELSSFIITSILLQCPARASSIELSTTSYTKWWSPFSLISPIYIAGLFRTASNPSRTCILSAE